MATVQINTSKLHAIMTERHWSEQDLAREMGLAYSFVNRLVNGRRSAGTKTLAGLRLAGIAWDEVLDVVMDQ